MEPAFYRGDLLFLNNRQPLIAVGDICVFQVKGRDVPIVHRVIETLKSR
jgi:signal peptidase